MRIHFISIGGSVMHQLAIALQKKGYQITGSDDEIFDPAKSVLATVGLLPAKMGWDTANILPELDAVIVGMHARKDNPELVKAQQLGLTIYSFPEYIYQESKKKTRVAIGGSHGKTSTTAMVMHILSQAKKAFGYLVGARLQGFDQSVQITDAPILVAEADEYPASALKPVPKFHFLYPHIAVITGIAWDHINVFPTFDFYLEQFRIFIQRIEPGGILIYNASDPVLKELVEKENRTDIRFTAYNIPDHEIRNGTTYVELEGVKTALQVFGDHNLLNLHAAFLVCRALGLTAGQILQAAAGFSGAAKRLELLFQNPDQNISIFRDFAHAPSKVKATIEAVKQQFPGRKLVAVLELHTYSSLNTAFMDQYNGAMDPADEAIVFYTPHALEMKKMAPLPPSAVEKGFAKPGLKVVHDKDSLESILRSTPLNNVNILLMSSGNYDGLDLQNWIGKAIKQQN
ncbi:UDP-N-acetylmuramate--L-alanine ligase [Arachidicoccus terrestris]|uniref:UDP-N-acetylmuramate--L-alanine ligase n=1 Tax=Arachidicoccus terrestris TaxID=2875539 RepID=UPI001CC355D4|nr:Mur ligase family protein [Arachidicoccus terrestris]UAY53906.1 peptidoglycan synthetase [Arachidicoccus terrestris]